MGSIDYPNPVPGLCRIEVLKVDRKNNSMYVAKYSEDGTFVTNSSFELDTFEKHARVIISEEGYLSPSIVLYVSPSRELYIG